MFKFFIYDSNVQVLSSVIHCASEEYRGWRRRGWGWGWGGAESESKVEEDDRVLARGHLRKTLLMLLH